jgi:bifunctional enzyme CysN/CysC
MDLVDYSPETFAQIRDDYLAFAAELGIADVRFVPDVGAQRRHDR